MFWSTQNHLISYNSFIQFCKWETLTIDLIAGLCATNASFGIVFAMLKLHNAMANKEHFQFGVCIFLFDIFSFLYFLFQEIFSYDFETMYDFFFIWKSQWTSRRMKIIIQNQNQNQVEAWLYVHLLLNNRRLMKPNGVASSNIAQIRSFIMYVEGTGGVNK